jgi:hypothetical protein
MSSISISCPSTRVWIRTWVSREGLAKESLNPIGNIISLPFENNFDFGVGPEDAFVYKLNIKPVYPLNLGKVTLINRFIFPVIYQEEGEVSGLRTGRCNCR